MQPRRLAPLDSRQERLREDSARPSSARQGLGGDDSIGSASWAAMWSHDVQLLIVLLTEYRNLRLHHVEQLQHDRGDTAEMARPEAALQLVGDGGRVDREYLLLRVHLCLVRMEQDLERHPPSTSRSPPRTVRGYFSKSSPWANWSRFTKIVVTTHGAWRCASRDQPQVPVVDVTHRGNAGHPRLPFRRLAQFFDGPDHIHMGGSTLKRRG